MSRFARIAPAICITALVLGYLAWIYASNGYDPLVFATIGTRFHDLDPDGTEGYDGQFNYYIALDPDPEVVGPHLDVPAYRYQHILYPMLARFLSLGNAAAIPWTLVGVNIVCLALLTYLAGELIAERGGNRWGAALFGLWLGLVLGVRVDLAEPLAFLLTAAALWIAGPGLEKRLGPAALLLALAMLTKETVLPFLLGWAAWLIQQRRIREAAWLALALVPYGVLQLWLWSAFGSPGLGSGGAGATPFVWIPFAGYFQIAAASLPVFAKLTAVYLPGLLIPTFYALWAPAADLLRKRIRPEGWLLLFNGLMIMFAPFSTFREPLGIIRLACGLILCMWLYAAVRKLRWWSRWGWAGLVYLLFIAG